MPQKVANHAFRKHFLLLLITALTAFSCSKATVENHTLSTAGESNFAVEGINELRPGDIIVRPNSNLLPGSSRVSGGFLFGHAAIVVKGYQSTNIDTLLSKTIIIESMARDVQPGFQVREVPALVYHSRDAFNNTNFASNYSGNRYRLRLSWTEKELEQLFSFLRKQKGDLSTWNASKRFPNQASIDSLEVSGLGGNWADNAQWYCSLLVWQAVYFVKGIDLDPNGGYMVYPNDLITSPFFDNSNENIGRARF
jgi:hypothetical protein